MPATNFAADLIRWADVTIRNADPARNRLNRATASCAPQRPKRFSKESDGTGAVAPDMRLAPPAEPVRSAGSSALASCAEAGFAAMPAAEEGRAAAAFGAGLGEGFAASVFVASCLGWSLVSPTQRDRRPSVLVFSDCAAGRGAGFDSAEARLSVRGGVATATSATG